MKTTRAALAAALLLALALMSTSCAERPDGAAEVALERPLFVYVSPDPLGVNDFLIMGQRGIEEAAARHGATSLVLEGEDPTTREESVRAAVSDGADLVMVLGFEFDDILSRVAREAPRVQFLVIDQCLDDLPDNVRCAVFREHEAAFLIGATGALLSTSRKLGIVAAVDIPFLHRYTDAFAQGARQVDPEVEVTTLWIGGERPFSDPVRAKEQALVLAARGVDHVFAAASASNYGVFEAARDEGFAVFGLDVDQCSVAPDIVVESLVKRVDRVAVEAIDAMRAGTGEQVLEYGLASHALGLVTLLADDLAASDCRLAEHPEALARIRELERQIIAGEIVLSDPMFDS